MRRKKHLNLFTTNTSIFTLPKYKRRKPREKFILAVRRWCHWRFTWLLFTPKKSIEVHQSLLADWPLNFMVFSSEVRSYESKTMSIIFLKFVREMFVKFVQSSGGVQVAVLSSLRGPTNSCLTCVTCIWIWRYPEKGIYFHCLFEMLLSSDFCTVWFA